MKKKNLFSTIIGILIGVILGVVTTVKITKKIISNSKTDAEKYLALYLMMNQWVKVKKEGKKMSSYFEKNNFYKIAVYGMSYAGERLVEELKDSNIEIKYGIDKNADSIYSDINLVTMNDRLDEVDAVVITAITYFDVIKENLSLKMDCPIISLEDILFEL